MTVLVDTSVWVDHLRGIRSAARLEVLLEAGSAMMHPFVLGELALGGVSKKNLLDFALLPVVLPATHRATFALVRHARLTGVGIGWVDAHLLTAAKNAGIALWTSDGALGKAADRAAVTKFALPELPAVRV